VINYLCIIQARVNSSRLPSKVMLDLGGKTLLLRCIASVKESKLIDKIVVSTSNQIQDNIIEKKLKIVNVDCYRGNLNNVLERFYLTASKYEAKHIIRITADNPLMDGEVIDRLIKLYQSKESDYSRFSNAIIGLSAEVFSFDSLKKAYENSRDDYDTEHVTPYIKDKCNVHIEDIDTYYRYPNLSATIDTLEDYVKMQDFYLNCQETNETMDIHSFIKYSGEKDES